MKAFGAKTRDLVMMFAAQMFFSSLIVCLFLYSASNLCIDLSNDLLKEGILAYVEEYPEGSYTFTTFVFLNGYFFLNIGLIAASTILSVVVPIIAIRKIKPLTIIRTRN
jgi:ABC-type antimicrobial peptide transport system permease subunit